MRQGIRFLGMVCALGGLVTVSAGSTPVYAQLRGEKNASILNYLGRFHGVGYSDGYHNCPDKAKCGPGVSQAELFQSPSIVGQTNFRPLLGVQDRWVGLSAGGVGAQTYSYPSTVTYQNSGGYPAQYSAPYASPGYGYPTPASPVQPLVPDGIPNQQPRSLIPGPSSPSDNNPRMMNPANARPGVEPNGESQLPVKTGPVSLPAEFYHHYSHAPSGAYGTTQGGYSQSEFAPQYVRPQMNIGQPPASNSDHSILRQSSLAPSSY